MLLHTKVLTMRQLVHSVPEKFEEIFSKYDKGHKVCVCVCVCARARARVRTAAVLRATRLQSIELSTSLEVSLERESQETDRLLLSFTYRAA